MLSRPVVRGLDSVGKLPKIDGLYIKGHTQSSSEDPA